MILSGKLIKGTKILKETYFENAKEGQDFRDALEECLIELCKKLDIPVPLWLNKNTNDFARYRRTSFPKDQFVEVVDFDRFDVKFNI